MTKGPNFKPGAIARRFSHHSCHAYGGQPKCPNRVFPLPKARWRSAEQPRTVVTLMAGSHPSGYRKSCFRQVGALCSYRSSRAIARQMRREYSNRIGRSLGHDCQSARRRGAPERLARRPDQTPVCPPFRLQAERLASGRCTGWLAFSWVIGFGPCGAGPPCPTLCIAEPGAQRICVCRAPGLDGNRLPTTKAVG